MATNRTTSNPFATRVVAPGQLDWIPVDPQSDLVRLRERLSHLHYRAALVGPHGSGKSTLLEHLLRPMGPPLIRRDFSGRAVEESCDSEVGRLIWLVLRRGKVDFCRSAWRAGAILVLDGFEQLSYLGRLRIIVWTRQKRMGLVVTSHRPVWLPTLIHTTVTPALLKQIVDKAAVHAGVAPNVIAGVDQMRLEELLQNHRGNAREVMMQLYDEFARSQAGSSGNTRRLLRQ